MFCEPRVRKTNKFTTKPDEASCLTQHLLGERETTYKEKSDLLLAVADRLLIERQTRQNNFQKRESEKRFKEETSTELMEVLVITKLRRFFKR